MATLKYPQRLRLSNGATAALDSRLGILALKRWIDSKTLVEGLDRLGLAVETRKPRSGSKSKPDGTLAAEPEINHGPLRIWLRARGGRRFGAELHRRIHSEFGSHVAWIGPVYRTAGIAARHNAFSPFPDVLLIRFSAKASVASVRAAKRFLLGEGVRDIARKSRHLGPWQYWQISDPGRTSSFALRSALLSRFAEAVERVDFESMPMLRPHLFDPNDTEFPSQWNMTAIGAPRAWDTTTGSPDVVIAILDSGCDLGHPDLSFASSGINLGTMSGDGSPPDNVVQDLFFMRKGHGTCCAGIASAVVGNERGIAGVAGNCRILPLALQNWTDAEIASGIDFAIGANARVLSMSLGRDADPGASFPVIDAAIDRAYAAGLVIVAAAGNDNKSVVGHPARHHRALACIATGTNDDRKRPGTDDEDWGSSFGDEASVAAPGVKIVTTDIRGFGGFARFESNDYYFKFNGTSAATPHVAGLAGLIISAFETLAPAFQRRNAPLTNDEVRNIIEQTADKTGELAYTERSSKPNGSWNEQMGYGRINADRAVASVRDRIAVSGLHRTLTPAWLAMMEIRRI